MRWYDPRCEFLDGIKNLGYRKAYEGGLSFNLDDIIIPEEKKAIVPSRPDRIDQIMGDYGMGSSPTTNATTKLSTLGRR